MLDFGPSFGWNGPIRIAFWFGSSRKASHDEVFDADRFSLQSDYLTGTSVFNAAGGQFVSHGAVVTAVTALLGALPTGIDDTQIDLDALMSNDADQDDEFGVGDSIIFSIRQISDANDLDGFYATGSEIFWLSILPTGGLNGGFLNHGGHLWNHSYSLLAMKEATSGRQLDINAIEAASVVPEPSAFVCISLIGLLFAIRKRVA